MGFGLASAIGAKLACPRRTVVALVGDGGLTMSGLELLTAAREALPLTVIVFCDGHLGLIRSQQLSAYGHTHGTRLRPPDWELLARSVGATYTRLDEDAERTLPALLSSPGVNLLEVRIGDSAAMRGRTLRRQVARAADTLLTRRVRDRLRRAARRRG
jgi:acetolactate synthase-1/2/3 large subunit